MANRGSRHWQWKARNPSTKALTGAAKTDQGKDGEQVPENCQVRASSKGQDLIPSPRPSPRRMTFLDLPPEIRNIIYRLALVRTGHLSIMCRGLCCTRSCRCRLHRRVILQSPVTEPIYARVRRVVGTEVPFTIAYEPSHRDADPCLPDWQIMGVSTNLASSSLPCFSTSATVDSTDSR